MNLTEIYEKRPLNIERLNEILSCGSNSNLDVGCGNGKYVFALEKKMKSLGCDLVEFRDWEANKELFKICDASELPYQDKTFDSVSAFELLEHIKNPNQAISEFKRLSKKYIIISVPNCETYSDLKRAGLTFWHYTDPTHVNFFTEKTLNSFLVDQGIEVIKSRLINPISPEILLWSRSEIPSVISKPAQWFTRKFLMQKRYMTILVTGKIRD